MLALNNITLGLMGVEDDNVVVYGSRLVDEDELGRRKGKLAIRKGQVRQVAPWRQEVTDSEGRRMFHGAFSGGFSAGYYNTVGSKEGWTPSTFSSSRKKRAGKNEQTVYDFMDEDEKEELKLKEVVPSADYDALGSTATELARRKASNDINLWSSVVPGIVPDEIVAESQSIGVKLLMKMGWRQGFSIGDERVTFPLAHRGVGGVRLYLPAIFPECPPTPLPELDLTFERWGKQTFAVGKFSGYPLDANVAQEAEKLALSLSNSVFVKNATYPVEVINNRRGLGVVALKSDLGNEAESNTVLVLEDLESETSTVSKRSRSEVSGKKQDCLPFFTAATYSSLTIQPVRLPTPLIPVDFTSAHILPAPLDVEVHLSRQEPPEVPFLDPTIAKAVNGIAAFVARSGPKIEDILKQKHVSNNPQFAFLFEGCPGHEFYVRKLWEEQRSLSIQGRKQILPRSDNKKAELTGANRGVIMGERPLPRTKISAASSINSKEDSSSFVRSKELSELTSQMTARFTTGASDTLPKRVEVIKHSSVLKHSSHTVDWAQTTRVETPWRPTSLLCKRFDVPDPYIGKVNTLSKSTIRAESLAMLVNSSRIRKGPSLHLTQPSTSAANNSTKEDTRDTNISEDSIDLYKAIFSDDEDEDEDQKGRQSSSRKVLQNAKDAAGDFLESLGKELGLRV